MAGVQGLPRPRWGSGAMPRWGVQGGKAPWSKTNLGFFFGDQFAASQCTEIVKTIFCFCLEVETSESTFHYFLCHTNQFFLNYQHKIRQQDHTIYQFPLEHFKIYVCMSHDLPDYQS